MATVRVGFAEVNATGGRFLLTAFGEDSVRCQMSTPVGFSDVHRLEDIMDPETRDLVERTLDTLTH